MSRLLRLTLLTLAVPLLLALPAAATNVGWDETATVAHVKVMSYHVTSITIGKTGWSARVSFVNESKATLKVGNQFGLAFYANKTDEAMSKSLGFAQATIFSSKVPATLKPGQRWSGTISGKGTLKATGTLYGRIVFGPFTGLPGESKSVVWITDHALTVGSGQATTTGTLA